MIYNIFLTLFAIGMAPKILWQIYCKGKKCPRLKDRFGAKPPLMPAGEGRRIWIHAVSLGEVKAAQALIHQLKKSEPLAALLLTSSTTTGLEEACRSLSNTCMIRYLPMDFTWTMRRWVQSFRPHQVIFVEGDVWPNLVREARRFGAKTALVSGKISEKSARRFGIFKGLARQLFGSLDLLCVQNEEHRDRFAALVDRPIEISGNLKLDTHLSIVDSEAIRRRFNLENGQKAITISCTHAPEEKELLEALRPVWERIPDLVCFLAPRHPERFNEVAVLLRQIKHPFCRWSETRSQESIVLVDAMGQLPHCYSVSSLVVVAGSFSSGIGGHNVVEPCLYGCPVLFGPSMHAQKDFARIVVQAGAGQEAVLETLAPLVLEWLESTISLRANALRLIEQNRGSAARTVQMLQTSSR
ncbi:MAG: gseA [Parachlamydiales bacterium]|nr:gseA [Parachlamydiales bacterium]